MFVAASEFTHSINHTLVECIKPEIEPRDDLLLGLIGPLSQRSVQTAPANTGNMYTQTTHDATTSDWQGSADVRSLLEGAMHSTGRVVRRFKSGIRPC